MNTGVNGAENTAGVAVLIFGDRRAPRPLRGLTAHRVGSDADMDDADAAIGPYRRLVVVGADADLAAVLTRLLRAEPARHRGGLRAAPPHPRDPDLPPARRAPLRRGAPGAGPPGG